MNNNRRSTDKELLTVFNNVDLLKLTPKESAKYLLLHKQQEDKINLGYFPNQSNPYGVL